MSWIDIAGIVVSILTLLGFGTVMKLYWEDKFRRKKEQSEENQRRIKEERHEEIVNAMNEIMTPCSNRMVGAIDKLNKRQDMAEKCDQAILRNALMNVYYDCKAKGFRTEDDSKNYREMHEAYKAIGGNSFIDSDVSAWFNDLPLKPNDYEPTKQVKKTTKKTKKEDK